MIYLWRDWRYVWQDNDFRGRLSSNLCWLLNQVKPDRDIIDPKYYWHFAQSDYFWEQANKLVSGGGQPQFNANALKQIKVPIPYPNEAGKSFRSRHALFLSR
nr:restriction endonuclease subunit S [Klebsiella pneumoniae]